MKKPDEKVLVRYLLGGLSEEEQERVEDRAFADAEYLAAVEEAEADLIDAWVRGELSEADRRAFEQRFLFSPERRRKVEFARSLAGAIAEAGPSRAARPARTSVWQRLLDPGGAWRPAWAMAAVAVAVLGVGASLWLAKENRGLEGARRSLEADLTAEKQRAAQLARATPRTEPAPVRVLPSLVLLAGMSRAEARVPDLTLPADAPAARVEIQVEARDTYPRYRVELRKKSGEEVLTLASLAGGGGRVAFDVPASSLAAGPYEIALKGTPAGQPSVDIGYFYFRVRR